MPDLNGPVVQSGPRIGPSDYFDTISLSYEGRPSAPRQDESQEAGGPGKYLRNGGEHHRVCIHQKQGRQGSDLSPSKAF
jgi:hypothetical protein